MLWWSLLSCIFSLLLLLPHPLLSALILHSMCDQRGVDQALFNFLHNLKDQRGGNEQMREQRKERKRHVSLCDYVCYHMLME